MDAIHPDMSPYFYFIEVGPYFIEVEHQEQGDCADGYYAITPPVVPHPEDQS